MLFLAGAAGQSANADSDIVQHSGNGADVNVEIAEITG
jgi:hypothetical protein